MKKLILLLFVLFISIAACSQTITEQIVKYVPITEAQRDGLSPPSNQRWKIFNSTTGVFEYWDGTSWTIFSGGGGSSTLNGLSDVTLTSPANGQVLTYNGTNWINQSIAGTGDMLKSIYDINDDGVVDNSATLGGQIPNFYLDNTDTQNPLSDNIATTSSTVSASSTAVKLVNDKANANTSAILTKEDDLGNPSTNGYVLSSLTDGTRSWIANGVGGSVDQSANYNWTGDHSFTKEILIGDGTNSETRINFNDANANNSYIDVKNGEFSFNAWDGGVYKNIFNGSTTHFNLNNSTIASIDAATNKHVVIKEYTDAKYATKAVRQVEVVTPNIYTTLLADNDKTVNITTSGNSIILDGTGLPIGFQQNFFNNSGGDINIQLAANNTSIQEIIAMPDSNPAYAILKEVTPNLVWQIVIGGTQESSLLNISSLVQNTYTITGTEHNEFLSLNSPTGVDITLDYNNNTPLGTVINFRQSGGGQLTFIEGANVSIVSSEALKSRKQHSVVSLIKISDAGTSGVWTLIGDLELTAFPHGIATTRENDEYLHIPFSPGANTWEVEIDVDAAATTGVFWANAQSPSVNSGAIQLRATPTTVQIRYHNGTANTYGSAVPYSVGDKITTRHTGTAIEVLINGVVQDTNTVSNFSWLGNILNIGGYNSAIDNITTSIDFIKTKILAVEETFLPTNQSSGATIIGSNGTTMTLNSDADVNAMYYQL